MAAETFLVQALPVLFHIIIGEGSSMRLPAGLQCAGRAKSHDGYRPCLYLSSSLHGKAYSLYYQASLIQPLFTLPRWYFTASRFREASRFSLTKNWVDFLLADSEYLKTALVRRRVIRFDLLKVPILTIEDLILLKTMAGRLQDLADLEKIHARQDELHVDWRYVEGWKTRLGLNR